MDECLLVYKLCKLAPTYIIWINPSISQLSISGINFQIYLHNLAFPIINNVNELQ